MISTILLLRILTPEDFGISALATMIMFLFMSLCELGIRQYITKTQDISADEVNSAWSLQIIINLLITSSLFLFAPIIADILDNNNLVDVLRVLAFIPIIAALNNPGVILLEKMLDYAQTSKISIGARLISAPLTIYIAVVYKTYWALVIGQLLNVAVVCLFSYLFIQHRPQFRCKGFAHIFSMTKWLLINSFTGFIRAKAENFIINIKFGVEGVGLYDISKEFSHLPLTDIIGPASAPLLAGVSSIKTGIVDVYRAILKYLYIAFFFIVPSIVGIFMIGDLFVDVVMGEKWLKAIPLFKTVSLLMIVFTLYTCCRLIMFIKDDLKIMSILDILSIVMMIVLLLPEYVANIEGLIIGRVLIGGGFGLVLLGVLHFRYKLNITPIFTLLVVLLIMSIPFAYVIHVLKVYMIDINNILTLVVSIFIGALVYFITILLCLDKLAKVNDYFLFTKEFVDNFIYTLMTKFKVSKV